VIAARILPLAKDITWGYTVPYLVTGLLNRHQDEGTDLLTLPDQDPLTYAFQAFYDRMAQPDPARPEPAQSPPGGGAARMEPLSGYRIGQKGLVARVEGEEHVLRRLLEMGFVRGEVVQVAKLAPLGDPMELVVKGYHLSLRREECACILMEREA
jgi:ferrous iron transport protein A